MIDFKNFEIKRGPTEVLHNPKLLVEEGCWYLSTDTAELFIGLLVDGIPQLKPVNGTLIETSLATYATQDFVREAIASLDIPEINISDFATKEDLDKKADISYVDEKVASIVIPEINLDGVATEDWVQSQNYLTEHIDISGKQDVVEDLEEIRDGAALGKTALQEVPADYAKKDDLFNKDYNELINKPEGLATESFVLEKISEAEIGEKEIDLSAYAKKEDLFSTNYNDLENKPVIPEAYDDTELKNLIDGKAASDHTHEQYLTSESAVIDDLYTENSAAWGIAEGAQIAADEAKDLANQANVGITEVNQRIDNLNIPSIEGLASEEFVNTAIANIEHPANPTKVSELENDANYTDETRVLELIAGSSVATGATIGIDFTTNITVGHLAAGTAIPSNMTISQLLYKILFAGSQPDEPEVPEGIIGEIVTDELPLYYVDNSGSLAEIPFEITTLTEEQAAQEPTKSGFYQVVDGENNVIESGYHDLSVANQDLIYMIALPKSVKAENISVQTYSDEEQIWEDNTFELTDDISVVNEICDIYGMDISNIDTDKYTVWVSSSENVCTGSKIRYIITE